VQKQTNRDAGKDHREVNNKDMKATVPDKNGPQTPGINNFFFETAMWHVDVPQTKTMRWHIASSSDTANKMFHIILCVVCLYLACVHILVL
jgi:hypothetical protein